jgi:nicotinate phosphoribosyltransferase
MTGLQTDLYQLTMAAGFWEAGKHTDRATFELFVRRLPANREYLVSAGLAQAVEYLQNLAFSGEQIDYIRSLPQFERVASGFFEYLRAFRFTGDLFAAREGTPLFPGEPILTVRAPLLEAQIPETYLLATISFQSMIATKAARVVRAAAGKAVVEFGTRRAHSPEAGVLAGRASYIGGCVGTSNVETGFRYGVPVFGTAAHSWVMAFTSERESFERLQQLLGPATVYLIDSYDTIEGARIAISLGRPLWGVRLDSGDLVALSKQVRKMLDEAGLQDAKIMATGDLNEQKLREICETGAPIDAYGVGTELATSADAPNLSAVYKLVEIEVDGVKRYTAKQSADKHTIPGSKQIFRYPGGDLIAGSWECPSCGCSATANSVEALLRPIMLEGSLLRVPPTATEARDYCAAALKRIKPGHKVEYSSDLLKLAANEAGRVRE